MTQRPRHPHPVPALDRLLARTSRASRAGFGAALLALALPACSSASSNPAPAAPPPVAQPAAKPGPQIAKDLQFSETFEVRFGEDFVGYVVDVLPVPHGIVDERQYPEGTKLIQDKDFKLLGFISPRGTMYRFDASGGSEAVGSGSLEKNLAGFFKKDGPPKLVSIAPGVRPRS